MKKILSASLICAAGLFACNSNEKTTDVNADTVVTADNTMVATDTMMKADDNEFVMKAAVGGMTEVKAGELAAKMGTTADIKGIGKMMVTDHTKAGDELKMIAEKNGMSVPAILPADKQAKIDELAGKKGKEFDDAFLALMKEGHNEAIEAFEKESAGGSNAELKAFATKTLPTLKMHKEHVESGKAM